MKNEFSIPQLIGGIIGFILICVIFNIGFNDILMFVKTIWHIAQTIIIILVNGICSFAKPIIEFFFA